MAKCELGCFNRPWNQFEFEDFLKATKEAGYALAGFMRQKGEAVLDTTSPPGRAAQVRAQVESAGLTPSTLLAGMQFGSPLPEAAAHFRQVIDLAADVGARYVLTCGTNDDAHRSTYCDIIRETADYAEQKNVMLTLKPHGGISATSRELCSIHEEINHPNFGIYYDPGNVHYYTGESAAEDVKSVAPRVVAMCIKDNTDGVHGKVAIEPGTGEVNFEAVFDALFAAGFSGPCVVECLGGEALAEINESAKRTHGLLEKLIARAGLAG
jgi:sugar phosphate isomerase/epimerase